MARKIKDTKKLFRTHGPCSHAFYYILNREFGQHNEMHESASDTFAGGIMQNGHQCGMVYGTVMATGISSCSIALVHTVLTTGRPKRSGKRRLNASWR